MGTKSLSRFPEHLHRHGEHAVLHALDPVAIVEDDAACEMSLGRVLETSQPPEVIGTHRGPRLDLDSGNLA